MKFVRKKIINPLALSSLIGWSCYAQADTVISVQYLVAASENSGEGALASLSDLENGIAQLNTAFAPLDLSFKLDSVQYLTNEDVPGIYDPSWDTDEEENVRPFYRYGQLNIIVADLDGKNGHAYFADEATDAIEVEPEDLNTSTIAHEVGHSLSLKHTYQDAKDAPISLQESVAGWKYGDGLVDTPVDPGQSSNFENCVYIDDDKDAEGTLYQPDGFNIMGKGKNTCRDRFSPQQLLRMKRILATNKFYMYEKYGKDANPTCSNSLVVNEYPHKEGFNYNEEVGETPWVQDSFNESFNWDMSFDTSSPNTGAKLPVEGHSFAHIDAGHEFLSPGDQVIMLSPCYDLSGQTSANIEFYYQMYGEDTGSLALEASQNDGVSWQELWKKDGQQHTSGITWTKASVDLHDYVGSNVQFRLNGTVIGGYKGDISIDYVTVNTEAPNAGQPYPEHNDILLETRITKSSDDAEEEISSGSVSVTSTDLELVDEGGTDEQAVGIRFSSANIPAGAIIKNAYVQFMVDAKNTGHTNLMIRGERSVNSETFTTSNKDISSRTTTENFAIWSPAPWENVGERGIDQTTSSLTEIVQELVDQDSWSEGSAVTFIISGDGEREAESYDASSSKAPKLFVTYAMSGSKQVLGDWDDDSDVDMLDIRGFMRALQTSSEIDTSFDLNNDEVINTLDVRAMMLLCTRDNCAV